MREPEKIERRIETIDREWGIERLLGFAAGSAALLTGAFLVQHAVTGSSLPAALFRRLGMRTQQEIAHEKYSLRAMRGDFDGERLADSAYGAA